MKLRDVFWTSVPPFGAIRTWAVPRLLRFVHSALMSTLSLSTTGVFRYRVFIETPDKGALFVLWHDHTLVALHLMRDSGIATMMSRSRAGQMQGAFWKLYGWPIVWGSTKKKEGIAALRETLRLISEGGLMGFTPDGPKGPRREAHAGVVYLASKSGVPILPLTVVASRAWKLPTWDKYLIPKPFAHVHVHVGEALWVPPNLSRGETLDWQERVKVALDEAEAVAQGELRRRMGVGVASEEVRSRKKA
jgi:lysophospholipid acyltransferase (LPLAT)-like uncharacterized protein